MPNSAYSCIQADEIVAIATTGLVNAAKVAIAISSTRSTVTFCVFCVYVEASAVETLSTLTVAYAGTEDDEVPLQKSESLQLRPTDNQHGLVRVIRR